jgi:hypothetical protein
VPLTALQRQVFAAIRRGRSPESFVYGATVLNAAPDSPRFSRDIDLSHDVASSVAQCAEFDGNTLTSSGFTVKWLLRQPAFQRAIVSAEQERVILEWVYDSAFRFFPVEPDAELGYRLHRFDAATNKVLALAGRAEPRDFVDAIFLHQRYISLGMLAWAAAGKDEGLNPRLILDLAERFAHYRQADIDTLALVEPLSIVELAQHWREAVKDAREKVSKLPASEVGCAYLDSNGDPVDPWGGNYELHSLRRHFGSVGGAWPRLGA